MTVEVHSRRASVDERGVRTEVDILLPGTTLGRQVYVTPTDHGWRLPRPHRHAGPHDLVCMAGTCVVAVRDEGSPDVVRHVLAPGDALHVPPGVAHQVAVAPDSIMASYVPHTEWLSSAPVEWLDGDWIGAECG